MITFNIPNTVDKFEQEFREYLNASIIRAEVQEIYEPLSSEDEIKWLKEKVSLLLREEKFKTWTVVRGRIKHDKKNGVSPEESLKDLTYQAEMHKENL